MSIVTKQILSGSTNGKSIYITGTGTPGVLIHTAVTGTTNMDEIYIYAANPLTTTTIVTIEFGGVTSPNDLIEATLSPDEGMYLVVPGFLLNNDLVVRAFSNTSNGAVINGYVNRITA